MIRRLVWSFCASLGVLGCSDNAAPAPPPTYSLSPAQQWSGGTVQVRSASFHQPAALPVITSGTDTLVAFRVDDSTLAVTLPQGPSGAIALVASAGGSQYNLGGVQRYGLRGRGNIGTTLQRPHSARRPTGQIQSPDRQSAQRTGARVRPPLPATLGCHAQ
jgi:hypothetical protein